MLLLNKSTQSFSGEKAAAQVSFFASLERAGKSRFLKCKGAVQGTHQAKREGEDSFPSAFCPEMGLLREQQGAGWRGWSSSPCPADPSQWCCQSPSWKIRKEDITASRKHFPNNIILFVIFTYINTSVRKQWSVSFHPAVKYISNKMGAVMLLLPKYLQNKVLAFSCLFLNHIHTNCCILFLHPWLCERNLGRNYLNNVFLIFLVYSTLFVQSHYDSHGRFWVWCSYWILNEN